MTILWKGDQWKVTTAGVDTLDNKYFIDKHRVHEDEGGAWTWEDQMAEKGWVWMSDLRDAMTFARKKWPKRK